MGKSYTIGTDDTNNLKVDVFYNEPFIFDAAEIDGIRLATIGEIVAMKVDVIQRGGRKKDFWDLYELYNNYSIKEMIALHEKRYPYDHDQELIIQKFTDFSIADEGFDPVCLRGNYWDFIKADFEEAIENYKNTSQD